MNKLDCIITDICLPDYFSGDFRPWVTIPVFKGMTLKEIKNSLHSELNQDAIGGDLSRWNVEPAREEQWHKKAHAAINRLKPEIKGQRKFFTDLEESNQNEIEDTTVQAFFVFIEAE